MKGYKYFIDSNIFLKALIPTDSGQTRWSLDLISELKSNKLKVYISSVILSEIVWVAMKTYGISKHETVEFVKSILALPGIKVVDTFRPKDALDLFLHSSVKFIDALIASHPRIASGAMSVISYDHDFDKMGIKRVEPKALISK